MAVGSTKVVQVTNIAPQATKDQMHILFGYLGKIEDIRLYPTIRDVSCPVQSRICYIKFVDVATVGIAQHMTNTVFIDRALIVIPVTSGEIPDEYYALEMTRNGTIVPGLNLNEPKLPPHVVNSVQGSGADQVILTTDHNLEGNGLPQYPPLPSTYDTQKIEETRRTILVLNMDPSATNDEIISFFSTAGEVKYLRTCTQESDGNVSHILVEFSDQGSIINALKLNGTEFKGKPVEIQHATQPIVKPQAKSNEAAQKEIEEAMSRFKEAQNMINASIEPVIGMLTKDKRSSRRSRSRSRGRRRRSRSRSHSRRSRSRRRRSSSRSRRSKSRDRRRRSKSRSRRRSHSRSRRSSSRSSKSRRSRSKSSRRSRQRSKDRSSRAKSKDRDRKSRDRSRDRKRSKDRDKKSKERDRSKSKDKTKEKSSRESKEKRNDKESSVDEKKRSRSRSRSRRRSKSRDRKKDRKRSRSRGSRRRSPSPRSSRRRSKSRSRDKDRKRDKKSDKRDKEKKDKDRDRDRRSRSRSTRSHSKVPRNYDEEEKGFDADKDKVKEKPPEPPSEKGSPEKSDNMDISNSP